MATELVAIELQLRGEEGVYRDLQKLDEMLQGFSGAKGKRTIELDMAQSQQRLIELRAEINKTKDELKRLSKEAAEADKKLKASGAEKGSKEYNELAEAVREADSALREQQEHLSEVQNEFRDVTIRVNELRYALKNFAQMSWSQIYGKVSTGLKHIGQNMQTLGNALQRIGSPFQKFTSGLVMGAGYKALNLATEGLSNAFSRYDTMRKYPLMMQKLGLIKDASEAEDSVQRLTDAVDGLPTSLDEIVSMSQRFSLALGNMTRGENLAIAANNAFLASMATETEQYQGMNQLADLAAGKQLNEREWNSLITAMEVGVHAVGEAFGYNNENMGEFLQLLRGGKIPVEDFLDKLIEVGSTTDSILGQAAGISRQSWEALARNTRTAFSRMGADVLKSLDKVSEAYNGKDLIANLTEEKGVIDQWSKSLQKWIEANPDKLIDFVEQLKKVDFAGFARGMIDGVKDIAEAVKLVVGLFDGRGLQGLGWFLTLAAPVGRAINTFGGLLKGLSHPLALVFATVAKAAMMTAGEFKKGGLLGTLKTLISGTEGAKAATDAVETVADAEKAIPKAGKVMTGLSKVFTGWAQIATMVGGTALVGWGSIKLFKNTLKDIGEIADIVKEIDWNTATPALLGFADFIAGMGAAGATISHFGIGVELLKGVGFAGAVTTLAALIGAVDMALLKKTVSDLNKVITEVQTAIDGLNQLGEVTDVDTAFDRAAKAVEVFNRMRDVFKGTVDHFSGETTSGLIGFTGGTKKKMASIAETVTNLKTAIQTLNELAGMDFDATGVENLAPKLTEALSALRSTILQIPSEWRETGFVDSTGNLSGSLVNLKTSLESIVGENGILAQIPKMIQQTQGWGDNAVYEQFSKRMGEIGNALRSAYKALNSGIGNGDFMSDNLNNIREAIKQARLAVHHINELGKTEVSTEGLGNISALVNGIKGAFNTDALGGITETINGFIESLKAAFEQFEQFNTDIEIDAHVKLSSGFNSSVDTAVSEIKKAARDIRNAWRNIPSTLYKTIHATISATVDSSGAVNTIKQGISDVKAVADGTVRQSAGGRVSRNGVLYRSGGGSIFKARGTDKIPAMLTEGEYVHKKQAVDFFGTDFMRRVNAMDVRGAMQALLTRAGASIGAGRQSIFNQTINNNQKVVQNINTNNPNFAGVQMGRYVGAL